MNTPDKLNEAIDLILAGAKDAIADNKTEATNKLCDAAKILIDVRAAIILEKSLAGLEAIVAKIEAI